MPNTNCLEGMRCPKCGQEDKQKRYTVRWEIDVYASSARQAAKEARTIQLDPENTATFFSVMQGKSWVGEKINVGRKSV